MFEAFDKYIDKYRQLRERQLLDAVKARQDWLNATRSQVKTRRLLSIVPEAYKRAFGSYSFWDVSDRAHVVETDTYVAVLDIYTLDGNDYKEVLAVSAKDSRCPNRWNMRDTVVAEQSQFSKFLSDRQVSKTDYLNTYGRTDEWCKTRASKDAAAHRKSIEQKVHKIIGDVVEISEDCDGWYLNGSNGKRCHMWFIYAGGYNIQCLHVRCLVKEVKL